MTKPKPGGFPIRLNIPKGAVVKHVASWATERTTHARDVPYHDPRSDDNSWLREPWFKKAFKEPHHD